jgi:hypothetical protein
MRYNQVDKLFICQKWSLMEYTIYSFVKNLALLRRHFYLFVNKILKSSREVNLFVRNLAKIS